MKKLTIVAALVALAATSASAVTIVGTKHDLSATGNVAGGKVATAKQICAFCHTPHSGRVAAPLWNRNTNASITSVYNSTSLSSVPKAVTTIGTDTVSGFCMSCHDGVTQFGSIYNTNNSGGTTTNTNVMSTVGPTLGTDLAKTHPVGFSYGAAQLEDKDLLGNDRLKLAPGLPFYINGAVTDSLECGSCHAVHDNAIVPFLRMSNDASALCLACHAK